MSASRQQPHQLSKTLSEGDQSQYSIGASTVNHVDWRKKDEASRDALLRFLEQNGEIDRLKDLLRSRLIESGWRDEMKAACQSYIRSRGIDQVTLDELVAEITPRGRASVPDPIKSDILKEIRKSAKFSEC